MLFNIFNAIEPKHMMVGFLNPYNHNTYCVGILIAIVIWRSIIFASLSLSIKDKVCIHILIYACSWMKTSSLKSSTASNVDLLILKTASDMDTTPTVICLYRATGWTCGCHDWCWRIKARTQSADLNRSTLYRELLVSQLGRIMLCLSYRAHCCTM